ncbi:PGF-pre-PGF domain-containing protein, partial [archaeon]|nr:PGF-pre-PGF domain-containing protein [archaeon]
NESSYGNWRNTSLIWMERFTPSIELVRFVAQNTSSAVLNVSASEVVYCEYKNTTGPGGFAPFANTNALTSTASLNLSIGDYNYTINCNDTANKFANDTFTFSIVNCMLPPLASVSKKLNMTADVPVEVNMSTYLNLTIVPARNASGWVSIARYNLNPEASSVGLPANKLFYYVVTVDPQIRDNASYVQVKIPYTHAEIVDADVYESTMNIYQYNLATGEWATPSTSARDIIENYGYANVTSFRTFVLAGAGAPGAAASSGASGDLQGAKPLKPKPPEKPALPVAPIRFSPEIRESRFAQHFESLPKGMNVIDIRNSRIGVIGITFEADSEHANMDFNVEKNEEPEHLVKNAYRYFAIDTPIRDAKDIKVRLGVEKEWLKKNNFDKQKMQLLKFKDRKWVRPRFVNMTEEDDSYVYYEMEVDALAGEYAIAAVEEISEEPIEEYIEAVIDYKEVAVTAVGSLALATILSFFVFKGFANVYARKTRKRFFKAGRKPKFLEEERKGIRKKEKEAKLKEDIEEKGRRRYQIKKRTEEKLKEIERKVFLKYKR